MSVLIGDPGRAYLPPDLREMARYDVPVSADLEDVAVKVSRVYRL